jgi:hypothetical protein
MTISTQSMPPLEEDQDGDGDPINEEKDISDSCLGDLHNSEAYETLGMEMNTTLSLQSTGAN